MSKASMGMGILILTLGILLSCFYEIYTLPKIPVRSLPTKSSLLTSKLTNVSLAQYHLFGIVNQQLMNLSKTNLPMTLEGILTGKENLAIIQINQQPAKVYHIGESILGLATLKKIQTRQVILSHQGRLTSLPLPDELK